MWAVSQSAVRAMWEAMRYLAMRAGHLDQVCCYVAGEEAFSYVGWQVASCMNRQQMDS